MSQSSQPKDDFFESSDSHHIGILEAVENLSNIADMDIDDKLGLIEDHVIVHGLDEEESLEAIRWLEDKSEHQTEQVVEETYRAVLDYVKNFHQKEFNRFYDKKNQDGIKKIMVLVGKASEKLNNYTHLFKGVHQKGIEETKEYKQLNKFYQERIAIEDEEKISLIDLSRKEQQLEARKHPRVEEDEYTVESKKFVLDLEKVKADENYELLYIQRDDGSRFMESNLFKNLKVACNFGEFAGNKLERDPIEGLENWLDLSSHKTAIRTLRGVQPYLQDYFSEALKYKDMDVVSQTTMALMSLMLAANPKNRAHLNPPKAASAFYQDFQHYLRGALGSFEYQKMRSFPPPPTNVFLVKMLKIIHTLSWSFFFHTADTDSLSFVIDDMLEEGKLSVKKQPGRSKKIDNFYETLKADYLQMQRYLLGYPIGPLFKTLKTLQEWTGEAFDPYMMGNLPMEAQALKVDHIPVSLLRMPAPLHQEIISRVELTPEFMGLMDADVQSANAHKHLFINLHDRTSWKENTRSQFLENIPKKGDYLEYLHTVTLAKCTDFYHQTGHYEEVYKSKDFLKQLVTNLHSLDTGFYFNTWVGEELFSGFCEKLIGCVHKFFFDGKSTLSQAERQDFIEIIYQFITLKVIELIEPTSMSFVCKDAIDQSGVSTLLFNQFLKLIQGKKLGDKERQNMHLLLFAYPTLVRQRPVSAKNFLRMVQCLERLDEGLKKHGHAQFIKIFSKIFKVDLKAITFDKPTFEKRHGPVDDKGASKG